MVLSDGFTDYTLRTWIQSRLGTNLFNANQFKFARRTRSIIACKLMFADVTAFMAPNHQVTEEIISHFLESAKAFWTEN